MNASIALFECHTSRDDHGVASTKANEIKVRRTTEMLLYEELARARIHDLERDLRVLRLRSNARSYRRWNRMARWAARRAHRFAG
jgi:hypothetical protein